MLRICARFILGGIFHTLGSLPGIILVGFNFVRFFSQRHVALVSPCPNCHGCTIWSGILILDEMILTGFSSAMLGIAANRSKLTNFNASFCWNTFSLNQRAPLTAR